LSQSNGTQADKPLDLITIGRASVDLYGQQIGTRGWRMSPPSPSPSAAAPPTSPSARRGSASEIGAADPRRQGAVGPLPARAARSARASRRRVSASRQIPERLTALAILARSKATPSFPLLFYRENCADMRALRKAMFPNRPSSVQGPRHRGHGHAFREAQAPRRPSARR
jgi:5-dehydro-2-deoxygluconokinase